MTGLSFRARRDRPVALRPARLKVADPPLSKHLRGAQQHRSTFLTDTRCIHTSTSDYDDATIYTCRVIRGFGPLGGVGEQQSAELIHLRQDTGINRIAYYYDSILQYIILVNVGPKLLQCKGRGSERRLPNIRKPFSVVPLLRAPVYTSCSQTKPEEPCRLQTNS